MSDAPAAPMTLAEIRAAYPPEIGANSPHAFDEPPIDCYDQAEDDNVFEEYEIEDAFLDRHPARVDNEPVRRTIRRALSSFDDLPIEWAWEDRIPLSAVSLLLGREGAGKGVLMSHLIARWTRGQMPGDLYGKPARVAVLSIEDEPGRVLKPRCFAAGADLDLVEFWQVEEDGMVRGYQFPGDASLFRTDVEESGVRIVTIDSPLSMLPTSVKANDDQHIRQALLTPLTALADAKDLAVVIPHHLNRSPTTVTADRIAGSLGLRRAARASLVVADHPEDSEQRAVVLDKSNWGSHDVPTMLLRIEGFEYEADNGKTIKTARAVMLGETTDIHRGNLLQVDTDEERSALEDAVEFLVSMLAEGRMGAVELKKAAKAVGIATRTLDRAKAKAGARTYREGFGPGASYWWELHARQETPCAPHINTGEHAESGEHGEDEGLW